MTTSIVLYIPRMTKKATMAMIRDTEYQMWLRILRKGQAHHMSTAWRNCRCAPGLWELKATACG